MIPNGSDKNKSSDPVRMAVLDMGSTSFHLLIAEVSLPEAGIDMHPARHINNGMRKDVSHFLNSLVISDP